MVAEKGSIATDCCDDERRDNPRPHYVLVWGGIEDLELDETVEKIKINTRRFAKRTWFKTYRSVNWIDITEQDTPESIIKRLLE